MSIVSLFPDSPAFIQLSNRCFDEEMTALLGEAFDQICKQLPKGRSNTISRETIARRIIHIASRGERDPEKLSNEALVSLGLKPNRFTISTVDRRR
jgi:hypothetical protein